MKLSMEEFVAVRTLLHHQGKVAPQEFERLYSVSERGGKTKVVEELAASLKALHEQMEAAKTALQEMDAKEKASAK